MQTLSNERSTAEIAVAEQRGIWRIALNDAFYGDYTREHWAVDAAIQKARELEAAGGAFLVTLRQKRTRLPQCYSSPMAPVRLAVHTERRRLTRT